MYKRIAEISITLGLMIIADSCAEEDWAIAYQDRTFCPVVNIYTKDGQEIDSKDTYKEAIISISESDGYDFTDSATIKGRGNSTWKRPKKPYTIKFFQKRSVLSLPENKTWILLANYYDPTLLRNHIGFYLGEISALSYTPHYHFVDCYLNGEYRGIYQLGEKIKIAKHRLNIGDDGFLLEVDWRAREDEVVFSTPHLKHPVNIKSPEVTVNDEAYNYIKDYVRKAEEALYAENFADSIEGYRKYMDVGSFVEYYLINEIAKSEDAPFFTSCYMNLKRGGKLNMGPVWDFDMAFGNSGYAGIDSPKGFYMNKYWYERLLEDTAFVASVKERFKYYYESRERLYERIDTKASMLVGHIVDDNKLWGRVKNKENASEQEVKDAYIQKVTKLKTWLEDRFNWLKDNL